MKFRLLFLVLIGGVMLIFLAFICEKDNCIFA